jgi:hypothetical protein
MNFINLLACMDGGGLLDSPVIFIGLLVVLSAVVINNLIKYVKGGRKDSKLVGIAVLAGLGLLVVCYIRFNWVFSC